MFGIGIQELILLPFLLIFLGLFIKFLLWIFNQEVLKWLFIVVGVAAIGFVVVVLGR
jgi:hypothetical protein